MAVQENQSVSLRVVFEATLRADRVILTLFRHIIDALSEEAIEEKVYRLLALVFTDLQSPGIPIELPAVEQLSEGRSGEEGMH